MDKTTYVYLTTSTLENGSDLSTVNITNGTDTTEGSDGFLGLGLTLAEDIAIVTTIGIIILVFCWCL